MKYKVNDKVQFKADSLDSGKVVGFEKDSNMYSIETVSGNVIKCTEHYIKKEK